MAELGWAGRGTYILGASTPYSGKTLATTAANKMANPWAGKSIQEIRQMEYARNPQMKPLETTQLPQTSNATEAERARALAYLKEYVGQMRAAGFNDYNIAQKLMETKVIQIPSNLPENFGRMGTWASGMADERRMAAMKNAIDLKEHKSDRLCRHVNAITEINLKDGGNRNGRFYRYSGYLYPQH